MDRALSAAASGMEAQELKMSVIANNLANVSTAGFKKSRAEFQDVLYDNLRPAGTPSLDGSQLPTGAQVGQGVRTAGTQRQFTMGDLKQTGNALDLAIEGPGFFQVMQPNGQIQYTRDGSFKLDSQGRITTSDGQQIAPNLVIPRDAVEIVVAADGLVSSIEPDRTQPVEVGRITLAQFANPAGLTPLGHNLFANSNASGDPLVIQPGQEGLGRVAQGFLEMSNVRAVDEMIELIATQRAYEMGTRVIQAADQMLGATANIR